jgi:hypothetical protein
VALELMAVEGKACVVIQYGNRADDGKAWYATGRSDLFFSLVIVVGWASRTPCLIGQMLPGAGAHVRGVRVTRWHRSSHACL